MGADFKRQLTSAVVAIISEEALAGMREVGAAHFEIFNGQPQTASELLRHAASMLSKAAEAQKNRSAEAKNADKNQKAVPGRLQLPDLLPIDGEVVLSEPGNDA